MRHLPRLPYSGLTIILDEASRHDKNRLLSGYAGDYFNTALWPISREACDIRTKDETASFLPETKLILNLGEGCIDSTKDNLNDLRGNPRIQDGIVNLYSYSPQDAFDRRDYSKQDDNSGETGANEGDVKGHGITKRRNWKWWLMQDLKKANRIIHRGGILEKINDKYEKVIYPSPDEVISALSNTTNEILFLDIETTTAQTLTCVGFNFSNSNKIFVVPWKRYNNTLAYDEKDCRAIIQVLSIAFAQNIVVCHNASFDLLIMCWKYRIPLPLHIYDTMLAWHRCFTELEKSLGHLISYFLEEEFHKSEGIYTPKSHEQDQILWRYNAKDIITMREIYYRLVEEATKLKVSDSVANANSYIRSYLISTLHGLRIDIDKFTKRYDELNFKREQLNRCLSLIVKKPGFNLRSPDQVYNYLYDDLKLPCPNDEKPTEEGTLLKLQLKYNIPSIKLIMAGRKIGKMASGMKFRMWPDWKTGEYNRLTCVYNIAATDTFRLGSRGVFKYKRGSLSDKKGFGTNTQNWDKHQRDLIIADENKILGQVDQAGAEALIVAYLCRNGKFRQLFICGVKPHVFVALHVFRAEWSKRFGEELITKLCKLLPRELKTCPEFKPIENCIKDSDNWPAQERYYFIAKMICHACVDDKTEVLTEQGWVLVSKVSKNVKIATWKKQSHEIIFEQPTNWNEYEHHGNLIRFNEPELDQLVTYNHKICYMTNNRDKETIASNILPLGARIPLNGNYCGGDKIIDNAIARLVVATQADGWIMNSSSIRFHFSKERKIIRIKQLLNEAGIRYKESISPDRTTFIQTFDSDDITSWFDLSKQFGPWLLTWNKEALESFCDELKYWDGTYEKFYLHKREAYFSKHLNNHEWVKTILHLCGKQGTININHDGKGYTTGINQRCYSRINSETSQIIEHYEGKVYCPTVNSGFFLIRRNEKISITGNSNYGMKAPTMQMHILEKSEGAIVFERRTCEIFLHLYFGLFPEITEWHIDIQGQIAKYRLLKNLFGEARRFYEPPGDGLNRQAYAFIPQSTVGEITNRAFRDIQVEIDSGIIPASYEYDLLQNGHDSILFQCKKDFINESIEKTKSKIEVNLISPRGENFRMKSESCSGNNWGPASEYNPGGLK